MEHKFSFWRHGGVIIGSLVTAFFLGLLIAPHSLADLVRLNAFTQSVNAVCVLLGILLPVVVLVLYWRTTGFWKSLQTLALYWAGSFALCFLFLVATMLWIGLVEQHAPLFGTNWFAVTSPLLSLCAELGYLLSGGIALVGFSLGRARPTNGKGTLPESVAAVF